MKPDKEELKQIVRKGIELGKISKEQGDNLLEKIESGDCEVKVTTVRANGKGGLKAIRRVLKGLDHCQKFDDEQLDSAMATAFLGGVAIGMGVKKKHHVTVAELAREKFNEYTTRHDRAVEQNSRKQKH